MTAKDYVVLEEVLGTDDQFTYLENATRIKDQFLCGIGWTDAPQCGSSSSTLLLDASIIILAILGLLLIKGLFQVLLRKCTRYNQVQVQCWFCNETAWLCSSDFLVDPHYTPPSLLFVLPLPEALELSFPLAYLRRKSYPRKIRIVLSVLVFPITLIIRLLRLALMTVVTLALIPVRMVMYLVFGVFVDIALFLVRVYCCSCCKGVIRIVDTVRCWRTTSRTFPMHMLRCVVRLIFCCPKQASSTSFSSSSSSSCFANYCRYTTARARVAVGLAEGGLEDWQTAGRMGWTCSNTNCQQYNGFTDDGDYNEGDPDTTTPTGSLRPNTSVSSTVSDMGACSLSSARTEEAAGAFGPGSPSETRPRHHVGHATTTSAAASRRASPRKATGRGRGHRYSPQHDHETVSTSSSSSASSSSPTSSSLPPLSSSRHGSFPPPADGLSMTLCASCEYRQLVRLEARKHVLSPSTVSISKSHSAGSSSSSDETVPQPPHPLTPVDPTSRFGLCAHCDAQATPIFAARDKLARELWLSRLSSRHQHTLAGSSSSSSFPLRVCLALCRVASCGLCRGCCWCRGKNRRPYYDESDGDEGNGSAAVDGLGQWLGSRHEAVEDEDCIAYLDAVASAGIPHDDSDEDDDDAGGDDDGARSIRASALAPFSGRVDETATTQSALTRPSDGLENLFTSPTLTPVTAGTTVAVSDAPSSSLRGRLRVLDEDSIGLRERSRSRPRARRSNGSSSSRGSSRSRTGLGDALLTTGDLLSQSDASLHSSATATTSSSKGFTDTHSSNMLPSSSASLSSGRRKPRSCMETVVRLGRISSFTPTQETSASSSSPSPSSSSASSSSSSASSASSASSRYNVANPSSLAGGGHTPMVTPRAVGLDGSGGSGGRRGRASASACRKLTETLIPATAPPPPPPTAPVPVHIFIRPADLRDAPPPSQFLVRMGRALLLACQRRVTYAVAREPRRGKMVSVLCAGLLAWAFTVLALALARQRCDIIEQAAAAVAAAAATTSSTLQQQSISPLSHQLEDFSFTSLGALSSLYRSSSSFSSSTLHRASPGDPPLSATLLSGVEDPLGAEDDPAHPRRHHSRITDSVLRLVSTVYKAMPLVHWTVSALSPSPALACPLLRVPVLLSTSSLLSAGTETGTSLPQQQQQQQQLASSFSSSPSILGLLSTRLHSDLILRPALSLAGLSQLHPIRGGVLPLALLFALMASYILCLADLNAWRSVASKLATLPPLPPLLARSSFSSSSSFSPFSQHSGRGLCTSLLHLLLNAPCARAVRNVGDWIVGRTNSPAPAWAPTSSQQTMMSTASASASASVSHQPLELLHVPAPYFPRLFAWLSNERLFRLAIAASIALLVLPHCSPAIAARSLSITTAVSDPSSATSTADITVSSSAADVLFDSADTVITLGMRLVPFMNATAWQEWQQQPLPRQHHTCIPHNSSSASTSSNAANLRSIVATLLFAPLSLASTPSTPCLHWASSSAEIQPSAPASIAASFMSSSLPASPSSSAAAAAATVADAEPLLATPRDHAPFATWRSNLIATGALHVLTWILHLTLAPLYVVNEVVHVVSTLATVSVPFLLTSSILWPVHLGSLIAAFVAAAYLLHGFLQITRADMPSPAAVHTAIGYYEAQSMAIAKMRRGGSSSGAGGGSDTQGPLHYLHQEQQGHHRQQQLLHDEDALSRFRSRPASTASGWDVLEQDWTSGALDAIDTELDMPSTSYATYSAGRQKVAHNGVPDRQQQQQQLNHDPHHLSAHEGEEGNDRSSFVSSAAPPSSPHHLQTAARRKRSFGTSSILQTPESCVSTTVPRSPAAQDLAASAFRLTPSASSHAQTHAQAHAHAHASNRGSKEGPHTSVASSLLGQGFAALRHALTIQRSHRAADGPNTHLAPVAAEAGSTSNHAADADSDALSQFQRTDPFQHFDLLNPDLHKPLSSGAGSVRDSSPSLESLVTATGDTPLMMSGGRRRRLGLGAGDSHTGVGSSNSGSSNNMERLTLPSAFETMDALAASIDPRSLDVDVAQRVRPVVDQLDRIHIEATGISSRHNPLVQSSLASAMLAISRTPRFQEPSSYCSSYPVHDAQYLQGQHHQSQHPNHLHILHQHHQQQLQQQQQHPYSSSIYDDMLAPVPTGETMEDDKPSFATQRHGIRGGHGPWMQDQ